MNISGRIFEEYDRLMCDHFKKYGEKIELNSIYLGHEEYHQIRLEKCGHSGPVVIIHDDGPKVHGLNIIPVNLKNHFKIA